MRQLFLLASYALLTFFTPVMVNAQAKYFPTKQEWQEKMPSSLGLQNDSIVKAVQFAIENETKNPANMEVNHYRTFGKEPFGMGIGPFESRGNTNGLVIYKGYIVAKWGQPEKCDMTHSVTKSFLSTVAGLALETGHIRQLSDAVHTYMPPVEWYNPSKLYRNAEDHVPVGDYCLSLEKAEVVHEGKDITLIGYGNLMRTLETVRQMAEKDGISLYKVLAAANNKLAILVVVVSENTMLAFAVLA
jgi:hypothetical protein